MSPIPLCSDLPQDGKLRICQEVFQPRGLDSDSRTAETVAKMAQWIHESAQDPYCAAYAKQAIWKFGGGVSGGLKVGDIVIPFDAQDPRICVWGDYWWTKYNFKFVHHERLQYDWMRKRDALQFLVRPLEICHGILPAKGDCAIYSMMIATFLSIQGIPWELVTVKCDPHRPTEYAHIFPRAVLPNGLRVALDASHGEYPGWEVPREHRFATQIWDSNGMPIPDSDWNGLHGYVRRGVGSFRRGLGQSLDDSGNPIGVDTSSGTTTTTLNFPGMPGSTPTAAAPGFNWDAVVANLLTQGVNLAGRVVAPTTTISRGPQGQLLIQSPSSAGAASNLLATGAVTGIGSNWLLIGGGLLAVFLVFSMMGRR